MSLIEVKSETHYLNQAISLGWGPIPSPKKALLHTGNFIDTNRAQTTLN